MKPLKAIVVATLGLSVSFCFALQSPSPSPTPSPTPAPSASPSPRIPQKVRVSQALAHGLKVYDVEPVYPKKARDHHITGDVVMDVTIDRKGNVVNVTLIRGEPMLSQAAMDVRETMEIPAVFLER